MKIIIRADASPQIGTGHVMRCLALAQAWLEEGNEKVTLLTAALSPALDARLQVEGVQVIYLPDLPTKPIFPGSQCDAEKTVAQAQEAQASWVVVDGYQFGSDYQQTIKAAGLKLLLIDDYGHAKHYCADLVLNQNVYARASLYESRTADTQLLLKTRYALLRKEFWPWQLWRRNVPSTAQKVLVTLGGSDPDNVTLKAIQALQQIETTGLEVTVVVGGSNPHYAQLQSQVQTSLRSSECAITLQRNVTNMPALMAWADVAICAGGGTAWELAFMGLPSLMVILAENQRLVAETMDALGVSINLGWHCFIRPEQLTVQISQLLTQSQKRQRMVANAQNLVDGKGARRL
ncbi:MAG: UDP-2,4-diacetamido-2,4,6-trideoxy-beta-L-altropyranose hydrolase, partial [Cyanobacteria bacterium J06576_12]